MAIYCKCSILRYFRRFYFDYTIFYTIFYYILYYILHHGDTAKDIFLAKDGKEEVVGNDTVTFVTA